MRKIYYVYIVTNKYNSVLYTGVTNNLVRRVYQYHVGRGGGFTSKYNISKLVYYEETPDIGSALAREKQIKGGSRLKKMVLIVSSNPEWRDLWEDIS